MERIVFVGHRSNLVLLFFHLYKFYWDAAKALVLGHLIFFFFF